MLRILTIAIFIATLGMAGVLYKIKYDTRSLQHDSVRLRQKIVVEKQQLAVLKAEWSILTQPARIEKLARSIGLKQLSPKQIITSRDVAGLPFQKDGLQFVEAKDDGISTFSVDDEVFGITDDEPEDDLSDLGSDVGSETSGGLDQQSMFKEKLGDEFVSRVSGSLRHEN